MYTSYQGYVIYQGKDSGHELRPFSKDPVDPEMFYFDDDGVLYDTTPHFELAYGPFKSLDYAKGIIDEIIADDGDDDW